MVLSEFSIRFKRNLHFFSLFPNLFPYLKNFRKDSPALKLIRSLPLNYLGKLEIPDPWTAYMHENKANWKIQAAKGMKNF